MIPAFLSAGGYHHHIGLNTWAGKGVPPAPRRAAGLFHLATLYPERRELAKTLKVLFDTKYLINGASYQGASEAIYLRDPDQNGVEPYWDRPREEWLCTKEGNLAMVTRLPYVGGLFAELDEGGAGPRV
jgi:catechol 2,3-dioxygenase